MKTRYLMTIFQDGKALISFGINDFFQVEDAIKTYIEEYAVDPNAKYTHALTDLIDTPINLVRYHSPTLEEQRAKANEALYHLGKVYKIVGTKHDWTVNADNVWRTRVNFNMKDHTFKVYFKLNTSELCLTTID